MSKCFYCGVILTVDNEAEVREYEGSEFSMFPACKSCKAELETMKEEDR